jgi:hypothetical protein
VTDTKDLEDWLHLTLNLDGGNLEGPRREWLQASSNAVTSSLERALPRILGNGGDRPRE